MRNSLTILSFVALLAAVVAWGGVWFLFTDISTRLADRAQGLSMTDIQNSKQASAVVVHALVADTTNERAQLDGAVASDVVGIASAINAAGKAASVQTTIGSASVVGTSASAGVYQLEFLVQATGPFERVWRAAQLFQTLPLVSKVSELDFQEVPNTGKQAPEWQLGAHIDVLTSAQISP